MKKEKRLTKENAAKEEYQCLLNLGIDLEEEIPIEHRKYYNLEEEGEVYEKSNGLFCQNFVLEERELKSPYKWIVIVER